MYLSKCKFYKFSHFPAKRHKATQVKARCCCCKRHDDNKTQRSDATQPKRAPKLRERERHMRSLFGATLRRCRRRRWQRTWLFFFYVLRSVNEQHSGKCKAKRWAKKNVPSSAVSVKRERERQRVRAEVNEAHGERAQARESVRAREHKQARRRPFDAVLFVCVCVWQKLHKMSDALFFFFFARAAVNIFVVLLLPGDS